MAITAGVVRITLRWTLLSQKCQKAMYFQPGGAAWLTATAAGGAEAWWNHVKTAWRAMIEASAGNTFQEVLFEEIAPAGAFGTYAIPIGEQPGTRSSVGNIGQGPSYCAVGVRFTVGTRATRPGQMRVPFLDEKDFVGNTVQADFITLVDALADVYDTPIALGAPVATGALIPLVVTLAPGGTSVTAQQEVIGHVTNPVITSQVSRRVGHGNSSIMWRTIASASVAIRRFVPIGQ